MTWLLLLKLRLLKRFKSIWKGKKQRKGNWYSLMRSHILISLTDNAKTSGFSNSVFIFLLHKCVNLTLEIPVWNLADWKYWQDYVNLSSANKYYVALIPDQHSYSKKHTETCSVGSVCPQVPVWLFFSRLQCTRPQCSPPRVREKSASPNPSWRSASPLSNLTAWTSAGQETTSRSQSKSNAQAGRGRVLRWRSVSKIRGKNS